MLINITVNKKIYEALENEIYDVSQKNIEYAITNPDSNEFYNLALRIVKPKGLDSKLAKDYLNMRRNEPENWVVFISNVFGEYWGQIAKNITKLTIHEIGVIHINRFERGSQWYISISLFTQYKDDKYDLITSERSGDDTFETILTNALTFKSYSHFSLTPRSVGVKFNKLVYIIQDVSAEKYGELLEELYPCIIRAKEFPK